MSQLPWCNIGDFNDILSVDKKCGRCEHPAWLMNGFWEAVCDGNLTDIRLDGYPFTWRNNLDNEEWAVEKKLDRAMATPSWFDLFPKARLLNLLAPISDHSPILLKSESSVVAWGSKKFKFKNSWLLDPEVEDVVRRGWKNGGEGDVLSKLAGCTNELWNWGRKLKFKFKDKITRCKKDMEFYRGHRDNAGVHAFIDARDRLAQLLVKEELF